MSLPRRGTAAFVAFCALAGACTGGASRPNPAPSAVTSSPAVSPSRPPDPIPFTSAALRRAVGGDGIATHLRVISAIAADAGGTRAAGTPGFAASARYAEGVMRRAGLRVRVEAHSMPVFEPRGPARLEVPRIDLRDGRDFRAALYSGSGDVRGRLAEAGSGCGVAEYPAAGGVALVRSGGCFTSTKVRSAQSAGVLALLVVRPDALPGRPLRPTLGSPSGIEIPVLALTAAAGDAARTAVGSEVRVVVRADRPVRRSSNVIGEVGPRAGPLVVVGAHLDSVIDGAGINDNGSGVAAVLALAEALGRARSPARIRLALWGGEEYYLVGSTHHVANLGAAERAAIAAYVNLDMIGSPNAIHLVYGDARVRDALVSGLFGLPHEVEGTEANSDHTPFADAGIPVGGLFTGALEVVTEAQAEAFGATPGRPADPCYHQPCDDLSNVRTTLVERMADATAHAVVALSVRA